MVPSGPAQAQFAYTTNNGRIIITKYTGPGAAVVIPSGINGLPVTSIGATAFFSRTNLASVPIPNSVTYIGDFTFVGCTSLTNVTIGNEDTRVGVAAFYGCANLTGVYFSGNAPSPGSSVFDGDDHATVYCLPGSTGWHTPFGGRPTVLWSPQSRPAPASACSAISSGSPSLVRPTSLSWWKHPRT